MFSRGINWRKQGQHLPKIRRFISVTFNVRSAKKLPSGLLQKKKKIEVIVIVYIGKRRMRKMHKQHSVYLQEMCSIDMTTLYR